MKSRSILSFIGSALGVSAFCAAGVLGQDIKFEDLNAKITFDKAPIQSNGPVPVSYADSLEKAMPAVVTVFSTKEIVRQPRSGMFEDPFFRRFFNIPEDMEQLPPRKDLEQGLGSGVIISEDGYILTNNHVVGGADEIMVALTGDKNDYPAKVIGADPGTDVALIKIEKKGLRPIVVGDSSHLRVGDVTMAIGNPFGLEQTVTLGIVSALGRADLNITGGGYENFIQMDASINRGNSGGALVDAHGRLIGINTAIQSGMAGGNIGIGFAIPVNMALNIVKSLLENDGKVKRGFLGVLLKELDSNMAQALGRDDRAGVLITEVGVGTPAEKAGLKAGDLIVGYNGTPVESMSRLRLEISNTNPGTEVTFDIIRRGKEKKLAVALGDLSNPGESFASVQGTGETEEKAKEGEKDFIDGVQIQSLNDETRTAFKVPEDVRGVIVAGVKPDSAAAEAGLQAGEIITQIDQKDVASLEDAAKAIAEFKGEVLLLQVFGEGRRDILAVPIGKKD